MKIKKINSNLFNSKMLEDQLAKVQGGMPTWTSKHDDTSMDSGNSDVFFGTYDQDGESSVLDIADTGGTTKDKPLG